MNQNNQKILLTFQQIVDRFGRVFENGTYNPEVFHDISIGTLNFQSRSYSSIEGKELFNFTGNHIVTSAKSMVPLCEGLTIENIPALDFYKGIANKVFKSRKYKPFDGNSFKLYPDDKSITQGESFINIGIILKLCVLRLETKLNNNLAEAMNKKDYSFTLPCILFNIYSNPIPVQISSKKPNPGKNKKPQNKKPKVIEEELKPSAAEQEIPSLTRQTSTDSTQSTENSPLVKFFGSNLSERGETKSVSSAKSLEILKSIISNQNASDIFAIIRMEYGDDGISSFEKLSQPELIDQIEYKFCPIHSKIGTSKHSRLGGARLESVKYRTYAYFTRNLTCYDKCYEVTNKAPVFETEEDEIGKLISPIKTFMAEVQTDSERISNGNGELQKIIDDNRMLINFQNSLIDQMTDLCGNYKSEDIMKAFNKVKSSMTTPDIVSGKIISSIFGTREEIVSKFEEIDYEMEMIIFSDISYEDSLYHDQILDRIHTCFDIGNEYSEETIDAIIDGLKSAKNYEDPKDKVEIYKEFVKWNPDTITFCVKDRRSSDEEELSDEEEVSDEELSDEKPSEEEKDLIQTLIENDDQFAEYFSEDTELFIRSLNYLKEINREKESIPIIFSNKTTVQVWEIFNSDKLFEKTEYIRLKYNKQDNDLEKDGTFLNCEKIAFKNGSAPNFEEIDNDKLIILKFVKKRKYKSKNHPESICYTLGKAFLEEYNYCNSVTVDNFTFRTKTYELCVSAGVLVMKRCDIYKFLPEDHRIKIGDENLPIKDNLNKISRLNTIYPVKLPDSKVTKEKILIDLLLSRTPISGVEIDSSFEKFHYLSNTNNYEDKQFDKDKFNPTNLTSAAIESLKTMDIDMLEAKMKMYDEIDANGKIFSQIFEAFKDNTGGYIEKNGEYLKKIINQKLELKEFYKLLKKYLDENSNYEISSEQFAQNASELLFCAKIGETPELKYRETSFPSIPFYNINEEVLDSMEEEIQSFQHLNIEKYSSILMDEKISNILPTDQYIYISTICPDIETILKNALNERKIQHFEINENYQDFRKFYDASTQYRNYDQMCKASAKVYLLMKAVNFEDTTHQANVSREIQAKKIPEKSVNSFLEEFKSQYQNSEKLLKLIDNFVEDFNFATVIINYRNYMRSSFSELANSGKLYQYSVVGNEIIQSEVPVVFNVSSLSEHFYGDLIQKLENAISNIDIAETSSTSINQKIQGAINIPLDLRLKFYNIAKIRNKNKNSISEIGMYLILFHIPKIYKDIYYPDSPDSKNNFNRVYGSEKVQILNELKKKIDNAYTNIVTTDANINKNKTKISENENNIANRKNNLKVLFKSLQERFVYHSCLLSSFLRAYKGSMSINRDESNLRTDIESLSINNDNLIKKISDLKILSFDIYVALVSIFPNIYRVRLDLHKGFETRNDYHEKSIGFSKLLKTLVTSNFEKSSSTKEDLNAALESHKDNALYNPYVDKQFSYNINLTASNMTDAKLEKINEYFYIRDYLNFLITNFDLLILKNRPEKFKKFENNVKFLKYGFLYDEKLKQELLTFDQGFYETKNIDKDTKIEMEAKIDYAISFINDTLETLRLVNSGPGIHRITQTLYRYFNENFDESFEELKKGRKTVDFKGITKTKHFKKYVSILNGKMDTIGLGSSDIRIISDVKTHIDEDSVRQLFILFADCKTKEELQEGLEKLDREFLREVLDSFWQLLDEYKIPTNGGNSIILDENLYLKFIMNVKTEAKQEEGKTVIVKTEYTPVSSGRFLENFVKSINKVLNQLFINRMKAMDIEVVNSYLTFIQEMEKSFGDYKRQEARIRERI